MALAIDPGEGDAIDLDALADALDAAKVDARDEAGFAALGPLLARLGRNRHFLADHAIAALKARGGETGRETYGAQVLTLRPANGRYLLRANFWPAADDAVVRASGAAAFFYGLPHDHNFPFLTYGYLGPGYRSDDYEATMPADARVGDDAGLRFAGRTQLTSGALLLYRAHRDVHAQRPPDALSVSLNILGYDHAQPWRTQYRFDLAAGTVAEALTVTPSEILVALAAQFGGGTGIDLAHHMLATHPSPRMRRSALAALCGAMPDGPARAALYERAAGDPALMRDAGRALKSLHNGGDPPPLV